MANQILNNNWKFLSGPFEGMITNYEVVLDVPFIELDKDMQERILEWAKTYPIQGLSPDEYKVEYESSWESVMTYRPATLMTASMVNQLCNTVKRFQKLETYYG